MPCAPRWRKRRPALRPIPTASSPGSRRLRDAGPGQGDPLFPWLAEAADRDQMRWFLGQEAAGEAGFEDLLAYTQIRMPARAKLEFARNYWDEMGRGNPKGMHGPMLAVLIDTLDLAASIDDTVWESLALANAMTGMATARRYAWHSVGALGVIELTAPDRSAATAAGLRRLGFSPVERRYFDLHAVLDVKHSEAWNREALRPLVEEDQPPRHRHRRRRADAAPLRRPLLRAVSLGALVMLLGSAVAEAGATERPIERPSPRRWGVDSETGRLTDLLLSPPTHLAMVPCNAVTRDSLARGLSSCAASAGAQHRALVSRLEAAGARCHLVPPKPGLADLAFTRDSVLMTPWGLVELRPSEPHRRGEPAHLAGALRALGIESLGAVDEGRVEGGDVCLLRPGLVMIGISGERTDEAGARALGRIFERARLAGALHPDRPALPAPRHPVHLGVERLRRGLPGDARARIRRDAWPVSASS